MRIALLEPPLQSGVFQSETDPYPYPKSYHRGKKKERKKEGKKKETRSNAGPVGIMIVQNR